MSRSIALLNLLSKSILWSFLQSFPVFVDFFNLTWVVVAVSRRLINLQGSSNFGTQHPQHIIHIFIHIINIVIISFIGNKILSQKNYLKKSKKQNLAQPPSRVDFTVTLLASSCSLLSPLLFWWENFDRKFSKSEK